MPTPANATVQLDARTRRRIEACAAQAYPAEACGLLAGRRAAAGVRIEEVLPCANRATRRDRFDIDPVEWLRAERAAARAGLEMVGVWHSHPDADARPSSHDAAAAWPDQVQLIVAVRDGRPDEMGAWLREGGSLRACAVEEAPAR